MMVKIGTGTSTRVDLSDGSRKVNRPREKSVFRSGFYVLQVPSEIGAVRRRELYGRL